MGHKYTDPPDPWFFVREKESPIKGRNQNKRKTGRHLEGLREREKKRSWMKTMMMVTGPGHE